MAAAATAAAMKSVASRKSAGAGKGKKARIASAHNTDTVYEFVTALESAKDLATFEAFLDRNAAALARVTKTPGARLLKVTLQDGTTDADVTISGTLSFKGRAATKGARDSCMGVNDVVILDGGRAAGKLPTELFGIVQGHFDRLGVSYPTGFFQKGTGDATAAAAAAGYEWETNETAAMAALSSAASSKKKVGVGAGGGAAADASSDEEFNVADI
jgi:hypothetical protein